MAKTQIKNYIFKPGIGSNDNLYSDAYSLLTSNKEFLQKEMSAFITNSISNAQQFTPTDAVYTPTTGVIVFTIGTHSFTVGDAITLEQDSIRFTCELDGNATNHDYPRITDPAFNKALIITSVTSTTITVNVGISSDTSVHTFVSATANALKDCFYGYTNTSEAKCERDVGYILDGYAYDLRYGGNSKTRKNISYYWDETVAQVDGNRGAELVTHKFIRDLITDYIFTNTAYSSLQSEQAQVIDTTKIVATDKFYTPTNATYTPSDGKMVVTIPNHDLVVGSSIVFSEGAITFTCALDANATLHPYPRATGVPNASGRDPFYETACTISEITSNTITVNVGISSDTSKHTFDSALVNGIRANAADIIDTLAYATITVISEGLTHLPTNVKSGVGFVKIQGRYNADELLLISNATRSEVLYNFTNIATGAKVTVSDLKDDDFVSFKQTTDGVTTIELNADTRTSLETDEIQIFVERIENGRSVVTTRPYDFGTDAIERMRVAPALSMLDADFEYGLQPTKWAAIGTLRGYPSLYEVPGTDTQVLSVVSDASAGTNFIGQSKITVTTVTAHGFTPGTPISIKALEDSVSGAARAEGSFVIVEVPTNNSFTFFAKSKVGTVNPTTLSTTYTQLRKAGFYTGASIGTATYNVASNGSSGTMVAELQVASGSTIIPYDGNSPSIGAPLTHVGAGNMALGTQVTGVIDQSSGGGVYITPLTIGDASAGTNQLEFQDITGVTENLAIDRGDGEAIYLNNITGNVVTFSDNFVEPIIGNRTNYLGVAGINDASNGENVRFDISYSVDSSFTYVVDAIQNDGGEDYAVGDRILIPGTSLGGASPANDAIIIVTEVLDSANSIATVDIFGTHFNNDIYLEEQTSTFTGGLGSDAEFDVTYENNLFSSVTVGTNSGTAYKVGDVLEISGEVFSPGNAAPSQKLLISVDSVEATGGQVTGTSLQVGGTGYTTATGVTTTGGTGNGLTLDITVDAGNIITSVVINAAGTGYTQFDQVTVTGGGGDAIVRIDNVKSIGAVNSVTFDGSAPNRVATYGGVTYTSTTSTGSNADIQVVSNGTSYTATFTNAGINYLATENFTIAGTELGGLTPDHDCTIVIDNVDANGSVTNFTVTGTAFNGAAITGLPAENTTPTGATFNVSQNDAVYVVQLGLEEGEGYNVGQILTIPGTAFGAQTPENDVFITITGIDSLLTGGIDTFTSTGAGYEPIGIYLDVVGTIDDPVGIDATFNITRDTGQYSAVIDNAGTGYNVGNRIIVNGGQLGGVQPLNSLELRVSQVDGTGGITEIQPIYTEASTGTEINLICTVQISEPTTGVISFFDDITFGALATIEITFTNAHGLVPGDTFITTVSSDDGVNNHELAAGAFFVTDIPSVNRLRYQARAVGSIDTANDNTIVGIVYPRPDSFFIHRPFDGGVQLGTGGPQHGAQAIRQSKKYIRYQSGKGIMYTTGALFAPSYDLRSLTADGVEVGSLITVVTDDNDHGVQVGGIVRILGVETPGYNSGPETAVPPKFDYEVVEVIDERTYKIRAQRRLGATEAILGFGSQMSVVKWHGATVRSGIFDDQNGIFWEFDGTQISVVQRSGTRQLAGTISMTVDNNVVAGTNTRFTDQLQSGDRIIIKGMTHVVSHVNSQTEITVTPDWRGVVDITGAKANLIVDKKTKQQDFNLDTLDGNGPSGYDIDIAKMQMIGIQYSWYGAGFIDFMLRGSDGNFVFAHRMRNSNVNTEAFMRSGNLPVRYEVTNEGPPGKLTEQLTASATELMLVDSSFFPDYGTVYIDNEIIDFNGNDKVNNKLTGLTRGATFENFQAGANRQYTAGAAATHNDRTGVVLISQTITPLISHWGSAFITDGGFDEDRGYIFNYAETGIEISTTKQTAFLIRLAPSVSNALIGDLGERELLNRAQLLLQSLEVTSDTGAGGIVVEGVLNPQNYPLNPDDIGWSGLSSVAQGGQPSFAQIASGGSVNWSTGAAATNATITAQPLMQKPLTQYSRNDRNNIRILRSEIETQFGTQDATVIVGETITGGTIQANTTVRSFTGQFGSGANTYYRYRLSQSANSNINVGVTVNIERGGDLTNRNFGLFTKASIDATAIQVGTNVTSGGSVSFAANSQVNSIELLTFGGTDYYSVQFNNAFSGTLTAGSGTVQLEFIEPPFAQPGETIFSFIANPGERATVDFSELKELTNTPLGGRGTFPNGPDVLAINVYKVSGSAIDANIILNWGEAQA